MRRIILLASVVALLLSGCVPTNSEPIAEEYPAELADWGCKDLLANPDLAYQGVVGQIKEVCINAYTDNVGIAEIMLTDTQLEGYLMFYEVPADKVHFGEQGTFIYVDSSRVEDLIGEFMKEATVRSATEHGLNPLHWQISSYY